MCPYCDKDSDEIITDDGRLYLRANCSNCGRMLRAIPRKKNPAMEVLTFGKYKGRKIAEVPLPYLRWLYENATKLEPEQKANLLSYLRLHDAA
jgi:uncharacterized protein (DUF3820 family)